MAKKSGVNKSEAIRNVLAAKPGIAVKDVVATLKQKGIEIRDNLVYGIKQDLAKKAAMATTTTKAVAPVRSAAPVSTNGHLGIGASIIAAKTAAEKVGGWAALKEIVDAMQ
jgi:hypothetical protein